jgi:hypothetical protein
MRIGLNGLLFKAVIAITFLLTSTSVWADISVSLKLDRTETLLTDSVRLSVSVNGSRDSDLAPEISGLDSFEVRSGGTSSHFEFINGKMNSSLEYTYYIQPRNTGTFKIGPARVRIDGKNYTSNSANLKVRQTAAGKGGDRGLLFLTAELSKHMVYVEEQAIYTLRLYLRRNVRNINLNLPESPSLNFKQIAKPVEYRSTSSGKEYRVLEVRYALLPSKAGSIEIEPAQMSMEVLDTRRRTGRRFFDDPFSSFTTGRPARVASESLRLTVNPLPESGKPSDFSGLVGKFNMWSKLEPVNLKTGESATLTIKVSGQGNVNRIPDLNLPELDHVKVYADKPVLETTQDSEGRKGSKTMKWALVPEKTGRLDIPPVTISFFDPENHRYQNLRSSPYILSVLPGKKEQVALSNSAAPGTANDGAVKQAIKELGRDIFPVHTALQNFKTVRRLQRNRWIFWAMLVFPFVLYVSALCGIKLRRQSRREQPENLAKKASREFHKQLRSERLTCSRLLQLIRDYLNNRFGLSYGSLTPAEASNILISHGVSAETAGMLQHTMQFMENAEYTGKGNEDARVDTDLTKLIKQIEREAR